MFHLTLHHTKTLQSRFPLTSGQEISGSTETALSSTLVNIFESNAVFKTKSVVQCFCFIVLFLQASLIDLQLMICKS